MTYFRKISALTLALAIIAGAFVLPVNAEFTGGGRYDNDSITDWLGNDNKLHGWSLVNDSTYSFQSDKSQNYYTGLTSSVQDNYGNVTNYYRDGDTNNTKIIDSYNRTFNTIHNTTNNNNYSANVKLSDFLNTYATYNNDYTYSSELNSWYYDYDTNNYNYTTNQTYYNTDNSKYYVSIDNSNDEYYLVDIQYSPTFVTVNYEYHTTNITNNNNYGNVTNVYYYELDDGRNSYSLTVSEALGIVSGYDVVNYVQVYDDPDTLSLQHFDGNYTDSSAYGRQFFSVNRSTTYLDSGVFGKALELPSGSAAGVNVSGLSSNSSLQIDFRAYYDDIKSLNLYIGNVNILDNVASRYWDVVTTYIWHGDTDHALGKLKYNLVANVGDYVDSSTNIIDSVGNYCTLEEAWGTFADTIITEGENPSSCDSSGYYTDTSYIGYAIGYSIPTLYSSERLKGWIIDSVSSTRYLTTKVNLKNDIYVSQPQNAVTINANLNNFTNRWVSFRIVIKNGTLYYFVNGDLVGSGVFSMPTADKVYIKSNGSVYLDELRVSTGSLVNTSSYVCAENPFDTNMILALPDILTANTIYVRHNIPVDGFRIGGVRPSAPSTGFFYVPLHSDYTASQALFYDGSNWLEVDAAISVDGVSVVDVVGFKFTPASGAPDVNPDATPTPDNGSDGGGDSGGSNDSNNTTDDDKTGLLDGVIGKLVDTVGAIIGSVLDGIISLAESVLDRLASVVNIFGSFGDSLGALWSWLPPEILSVMITAVTVIIFVCVIKIAL